MTTRYQFACLLAYGRSPRKGEPSYSCINGVTREGARAPGATPHIRECGEPHLLYGISPIEAGGIAIERANQARDHGERPRRLRRDGKALVAGVFSYPAPRRVLENDRGEMDTYLRWRDMTLAFLIQQHGDHLQSVVEHDDETYMHIHFYVLPQLRSDRRLDMPAIHPGLRMKYDAAEAGASKKDQDAAYRSGLSIWQDAYWWSVSRFFGHERFGPRRTRVSRQQRLMERQIEEEQVRRRIALDAERARLLTDARQRAWEEHGRAHTMLRNACISLKDRVKAERAARRVAEVEVERLRARLSELEAAAPVPSVV